MSCIGHTSKDISEGKDRRRKGYHLVVLNAYVQNDLT